MLKFGPPGKDCKFKKVPPLGVAKTGKVSCSQYSGLIGFPLFVVSVSAGNDLIKVVSKMVLEHPVKVLVKV